MKFTKNWLKSREIVKTKGVKTKDSWKKSTVSGKLKTYFAENLSKKGLYSPEGFAE